MEKSKNPLIEEELQNIEKILKEKITEFSRLGGLTNFNYKLTTSGGKDYLIKFFSKKDLSFFISRSIEKKSIHLLSTSNHYPQIIHEAENFRIEEFIPHSFPKKENFFKNKNLAKKLAEVLNINMTILTKNFKNDNSFDSMPCSLDKFLDEFPDEMTTILESLKPNLEYSDFEYYVKSLNELKSYIPQLQSKLENFKDDAMICHNDACFSNFLLGEDNFKEKIFLVDLEYTDKNYIYFELANFIHATNCRWIPKFNMVDEAHIQPDDPSFEEKLCLKEKREFVEYFLQISEFEKNQFYEVCDAFQCFAHFYWIFLAISTCDIEGIEFDCVGYVKEKLESFKYYADRFLRLE